MTKNNLFFTILLAFSVQAYGQTTGLLIGSYTGSQDSTGIRYYSFDTNTGAGKLETSVNGIPNASYLCYRSNSKTLFSVSETGKGAGSIYAFQADPVSGVFTFDSKASSGGGGPCYVEATASGNFVFAANYGGGSLAAIRVDDGHHLTDAGSQVIQHKGSSINKDNQNKPHAHSAILSPDQRFLLVCNLGTDQIFVYRFDSTATQPLTPADPAFVKVKPGSGPRHLTFHPNGNFVYVVNELDGSVDAYGYSEGRLSPLQRVSMLPEGFSGTIEGADIHVSPDGKFLYASNREIQNAISIFKIDKSGKLILAGRQSTLGRAPRNFVIDPSGKFLLAANMNSNQVVIFKRDQQSGLLTDTGLRIDVPKPACLKFIAKD